MSGVEAWRKIPGFDRYEVSNRGTVRWARTMAKIRPRVNHAGYLRLTLYPGKKTFGVHRLVAWAFIGEQILGQEVNHRNGIKTDNNSENLEYLSHRENTLYTHRVLGFRFSAESRRKMSEAKCGAKHWVSVRPNTDKIREMHLAGLSHRAIAVALGVGRQIVHMVLRGRHWSVRENNSQEAS